MKDASGKVTRWGLIVPSGVTSHWFLQGFTTQNRAKLTNEAGTETYLDTPEAIESLQYWVDLSRKHKVMQEGIIDTGTAPNEFIDGRAAMMFHSTGNLTNVKNNAKFDFGVAMLPARKQRGSATGGGSIYIFKKSTPEQLAASYKFVKWMTSAEQAARWSIETGYVAPRQDAWDLPVMKKYAQDFPPAGGRAAAAAVLRAGVLDARRAAHDQGARGCDRGVDHRHQDAGEGAGRRAGRGDADPAQLQALTPPFHAQRAGDCTS